MKYAEQLEQLVFSQDTISLELILSVFRYQYQENKVYRRWCDALNVAESEVKKIEDIPFLPISFFKTQKVVCGEFEPELLFESSGTTQTINSKHFVKKAAVYEKSFVKAFEQFYGSIMDYCIIGLLPNYIEKGNSSLVRMAEDLIKKSGNEKSGFYLYDFDSLATLLKELDVKKQKTLLLGVTFALIDFVEQYPMHLSHTIVMDTGGMKGRKKEMTRQEVHQFLKQGFGLSAIHSEYGMTELLSQAYSKAEGKYKCPPWMDVFIRDETDPLLIRKEGKGLINVIDLANIYSCSFIATEDVGSKDGDCFEIWGRLDNSDLRGCSLLVL